MALDIACYVCKMAVAGVPDGVCKVAHIFGVIGKLDDDGPVSNVGPKRDMILTTFSRCCSSLDMVSADSWQKKNVSLQQVGALRPRQPSKLRQSPSWSRSIPRRHVSSPPAPPLLTGHLKSSQVTALRLQACSPQIGFVFGPLAQSTVRGVRGLLMGRPAVTLSCPRCPSSAATCISTR